MKFEINDPVSKSTSHDHAFELQYAFFHQKLCLFDTVIMGAKVLLLKEIFICRLWTCLLDSWATNYTSKLYKCNSNEHFLKGTVCRSVSRPVILIYLQICLRRKHMLYCIGMDLAFFFFSGFCLESWVFNTGRLGKRQRLVSFFNTNVSSLLGLGYAWCVTTCMCADTRLCTMAGQNNENTTLKVSAMKDVWQLALRYVRFQSNIKASIESMWMDLYSRGNQRMLFAHNVYCQLLSTVVQWCIMHGCITAKKNLR